MNCPFCKGSMIEFKGAKMPLTTSEVQRSGEDDGIVTYARKEVQHETRVERCLKCGFVASFLKL